MSRRLWITLIAVVAGAALLAGAAFLLLGGSRNISVETGERIVCTYGEVVTDTIRTVEVPAADAAKYKVVGETITCDRHKRLEALYAEAQAAILAGDLTTAREKLAEIVKTEPQFRNAQQQIDAIDEGRTPVVDKNAPNPSASKPASSTPAPGGTPGGGTDSPGKEPVGPVASLSSFVPDTLPGYTSSPIIADVFALTRQYLPGASNPTDALVVVVEQYKDATAAKNAIKNDLGSHYSASASTFTVSGRSVYFGTDGHRLAIVAWNEQGIVVAIEGSSKTGKPAELKSHLTSLVNAIVQ
jgi:hypothetical protein